MSQWAYGGKSTMDLDHTESIYTWYRQNTLGNDNVKWEQLRKPTSVLIMVSWEA